MMKFLSMILLLETKVQTQEIPIPEEEQENEMSLYNFKLAGLISGKDYSFISIVNSGGEDHYFAVRSIYWKK